MLTANDAGGLNPYDFANPVRRETLFAGRRKEREDIAYYLKQAVHADRAINLALLGARASGKTSLLNMIEIEATKLALPVVRIDLNESDVESQRAFCYKLFDSILSRIIEEKSALAADQLCFGGPHGKTFEHYLDMTSAFEVPDEKTFCPFLFPIQYAKSSAAPTGADRVSDHIFRRDLGIISTQVGKTIVVLVDECNVLSRHRSLLEMVRNTFMNLHGYMLVFAGTPDLFPMMDEVFSPIIRRFKKIDVFPFGEVRDTIQCIQEPLFCIGRHDLSVSYSLDHMPDPEPGMSLELFRDERGTFVGIDDSVRDIHTLTGGRPYEIQLVCHFMFRRVQEGKEKRLRLSMDVLEDVLHELHQGHNVDFRPIVTAVRSLDEQALKILGVLAASGGERSIEQLAFLHIISEANPCTKESLENALTMFINSGILCLWSGNIAFAGDDFDRIVCKYWAAHRRQTLTFDARSTTSILEQLVRGMRFRNRLWPGHDSESSFIDVEAGRRLWNEIAQCKSTTDLFRRKLQAQEELYEALVRMARDGRTTLLLMHVHVVGPGIKETVIMYRTCSQEEVSESVSRDNRLHRGAARAKSLGGDISIEFMALEASPLEEVVSAVQASDNVALISKCAALHASAAVDCFIAQLNGTGRFGEFDAASEARRAVTYGSAIDRADLNNLGYILMRSGDLKLAREMFERAIAAGDEQGGDPLYRYNLALTMIVDGLLREARCLIDAVLSEVKGRPELVGNYTVLALPILNDGRIEVIDRKNCELADVALETLTVIDNALGGIGDL